MADKMIIIGGTGLLGSELSCHFSVNHEIIRAGSADIDIRNKMEVDKYISQFKPDIVINCAAIANVDQCERDHELAQKINSDGPGYIAAACKENGARFIHISTDYVFDGTKKHPYLETDDPNPINYYGHTKYEGEQKVLMAYSEALILRVAWLYSSHEKAFLTKLIRDGLAQVVKKGHGGDAEPLKIVTDQIGTPTGAVDIARQLEKILESDLSGIIHCTAEGETSRYNTARIVFDNLQMPVDILPINSDQFSWLADRPQYTVLENQVLKSAGINIMPPFDKALNDFLNAVELV